MVVFITGASHTGKTVLAQRFLRKYGYPYLSVDHLKMGLIRAGYTSITPENDDKLTEYLWPVVREMAKTAIENRQNLMIEGCYIPPDWEKDFTAEYLAQIKYICLVMSEEYIRANFDIITEHACDIELRLDDSYCTPEYLIEENRRVMDACRQNGVEFLLIDGKYAVDADLTKL